MRFRPLFLLVLFLPSCGGPAYENGRTRSGLYYEKVGEGPAIIFIHAFSLDRRMWDDQMAAFPDTFTRIRYDLRGHGESGNWDEPFAAYDDVLEIFEATGIQSAALVGLSSGAETAIDFALEYPERVEKLVLASSGVGGYQPEGSFDWMGPVIDAIQAGDYEEATEQWAETPLMKIWRNERAQEKMTKIASSNSSVWSHDPTLQRRLDPPAITRIGEIDVPALILVGEADLIDTHQVGVILENQIEESVRVVISEAGHLINLAQPAAFNSAVLSFVRGDLPDNN